MPRAICFEQKHAQRFSGRVSGETVEHARLGSDVYPYRIDYLPAPVEGIQVSTRTPRYLRRI